MKQLSDVVCIIILERFFSASQWCIAHVSSLSGCWDMKSESSTVLSFVEYNVDLLNFSLTNFTLHLISWNILLVMGYMRTFLLENRVLSSFALKTEFKLVYFSWNAAENLTSLSFQRISLLAATYTEASAVWQGKKRVRKNILLKRKKLSNM